MALVPGFITFLKFDNSEEASTPEDGYESENEHEFHQETVMNDDKLKSWTDVGELKNGTKTNSKPKKVKRKFFYTTLAFCSGSGDMDIKGTIGINRAYYRYFTAPVTKFYCHTVSSRTQFKQKKKKTKSFVLNNLER